MYIYYMCIMSNDNTQLFIVSNILYDGATPQPITHSLHGDYTHKRKYSGRGGVSEDWKVQPGLCYFVIDDWWHLWV